MVSRNRAGEAVRALAPRENKARLLLYLDGLPDRELAQWGIVEADDNETVYNYILLKAQGVAAGLASGSTGAGGPGPGSTAAGGVPSDVADVSIKIKARYGNKTVTVTIGSPPKYEQLCELLEAEFAELYLVEYELHVVGAPCVIRSDKGLSAYLANCKHDSVLSVVSLCKGFRDFSWRDSCAYLGLAPMSTPDYVCTDNSRFEDGDVSTYVGYPALLEHLLVDYRQRIQVFGPLTIAVEYTVREFISPLLLAAALIVKGVYLRAELGITGLLGRGPIDYMALNEEWQIVVTEAKKDDFPAAFPQCMAQVAASRDECMRRLLGKKRKFSEVSDLNSIPSSSILTAGHSWVFLRYEQGPPVEGVQGPQKSQPRLFKSSDYNIQLDGDATDEYLRGRLDTVLKKIVGVFQLQMAAVSTFKKRKVT